MAALGLLALNLYGVTQLEQDFDNRWFIPSDSYLTAFFEASDTYFPGEDIGPVNVYFGASHCFPFINLKRFNHILIQTGYRQR